jgi:hypothetical protein
MTHKQLKEDVEIQLKSIIKNRLRIDIDKSTRKTAPDVEAKMIYTKILRDERYTWQSIAKSISRDHSTLMYQYKTLNNLIKFDKKLERDYIQVKADFSSGEEYLEGQTTTELKKIINTLSSDNKILILRIKELENKN